MTLDKLDEVEINKMMDEARFNPVAKKLFMTIVEAAKEIRDWLTKAIREVKK